MEAKQVKAKRIGDVQKVVNKDRKFGAASEYNHLRVQLEDKTELHLLFTDSEIQRALDRAKKNPEDLPKVSWLHNILD